jgi:hypothetical protein
MKKGKLGRVFADANQALQGRNKLPILACAPPLKHTQKSVTQLPNFPILSNILDK